ncbi:hypothetical protein DFA_00151 [Cavenderia fasciculata]|uniref:Uncharacterized protein n=1 Tax=Cavenderia fasciculata TaxID=261658 RepID=F4PXR3_CACFS|nr:uncharacterized protein DFA_00151 [Cavenderia fasciculata]EGG19573.1 hypothetical protein DFA_00151 [Cavenderia fasciculata]|eukprot:XP_004357867.1 hypothetical protein DFA_00151 [Cavenderia fasciculata]
MNFFKKLLDPLVEIKSDEEIKEREELGISEELIQFVEKISKFPQSFQDFPLHTVPANTSKKRYIDI